MTDVEVSVGAADVSVAVHDTVTVRLPENGTTGYVWSIAKRGEGLSLADDRGVAAAAGGAVGAGGEHIFQLRAEQAGEWQVEFRLAREWESGVLEERRLTVRVS
ncbi:putative secreted protein [Kribbella sp. VKM Ac-2569]|uniref:protease inhibitor I42 family protein n=1 Tax=Kribbella sp. VKM Ac-2569 TaxID=2512220 RepID=UPI00102CD16C|nr:protease inhibitor I42 family protein [Kribbella sp. VKM Ac-2569]RZT28809.1 putative secreted protein [Kribbella sp. VKM Ac-2569]